ncbi:hypothetical protein QYM36_006288 [Artemia franciscana]|uniref:Uncharacterized protein n=1 Tax=Artemia franciscana TaxID=6661 RepID=A0AA88L9P6_ARTSF|nr:hypothetical protein QYM36_006288 [Artemia franciscana]
MIFPISENDLFIPLLNSHILVSPPTVFSFYVVVGDGPVEQEDQQDENQNGFGKLLIKKQALPTLSQFLRGMPQQQSFFVPEASQYDQKLFRFQPAYQLNPAAFGPNQYTQSFQAAKIYQHPVITGVERQAPAAIMLDQYTPSYQTDKVNQQTQITGFQGQAPAASPRFIFLAEQNGHWTACKLLLGCVDIPFFGHGHNEHHGHQEHHGHKEHHGHDHKWASGHVKDKWTSGHVKNKWTDGYVKDKWTSQDVSNIQYIIGSYL